MSELKDKFTARCTWAQPNNGIIKALFEPSSGGSAENEYVLVNLHKDRGCPEVGKIYWLDFQPAFPH